ncbi:hypothetical protein [Paracoccus sp. TOH]|uniref:hypothetical protein n=1 Tax=Paracoccus sp. TOH TaxID=1263728 RepID=UPI0025AF4DCB|nr:hypothetical protein [Paracoccus sp. TOH]WJS84223.1 hypothetical protein NBE95_00070 [Paracoccus sp. TOH]
MTLDPAARYALTGQFDLEHYDRDREDFPSEFDANGWPLFGQFNPYALKHPITARPWY